MFKAETDGTVKKRLQEFIRSRGFPPWFSATTSPKGSYREHDVLAFIGAHLPAVADDGRRWRILLADDYKAHKTSNVSNLAWERGCVMMHHGGGATPVSQTPDTDLNCHVRREYTDLESEVLLEKMQRGNVLPKASPEECCLMMLDVLKGEDIHLNASQGYKMTGQTIDLHGAEDALVVREAGTFWNERTTDGYANMRSKLDVELAAVADEFEAGGLPWCRRSVERLISPSPSRPDADAILHRLGEDFYHDEIHRDADACEQEAAVADEDSDDAPDDEAIAPHPNDEQPGDDPSNEALVAVKMSADAAATDVTLAPEEADEVQTLDITIEALSECIESVRSVGALSAAQSLQRELRSVHRRKRCLSEENPAVADAFLQRRKADATRVEKQRRIASEMAHQEKRTRKAQEDAQAAVAELRQARKAIVDAENMKESVHAMKTFTVGSLGAGVANAGGANGRKRRFEVLDRMARSGAGLSAGQKNDWAWFKESWDAAMLAEHKAKWPEVLAGWMQNLINSSANNAFSVFVYDETRRLFSGATALHVP